jgi:hypothetical protein
MMLDERRESVLYRFKHSRNLSRSCCHGVGGYAMNVVVLLIVLLLLFGGGGFYMGGPLVGGSLGGLILLVLVVMLLTGRLGSRA